MSIILTPTLTISLNEFKYLDGEDYKSVHRKGLTVSRDILFLVEIKGVLIFSNLNLFLIQKTYVSQ